MRPGPSADDAICLTVSGNTTAGSNGAEGIGVRKQGAVATINDFRIPAIGIASPTIAQVETFIEGQNPAGGGAFVINGDAFLGTGPCP